jgi:hypothetical protein
LTWQAGDHLGIRAILGTTNEQATGWHENAGCWIGVLAAIEQSEILWGVGLVVGIVDYENAPQFVQNK